MMRLAVILLASLLLAPCAGAESARQMTQAADALIASLSDEQRTVMLRDFEKEPGRTHWSNLPASMVKRSGLRLGDMSDAQRVRLHDLLRASTSAQGYQKLAGVVRLDEILHVEASEAVANRTRRLPKKLVESWRAENYWVSVFGQPSADGTWGWQLSGHHLGANFTVHEGKLGFTPMFLGAEPHKVQQGPEAGWMVLSHEAERGLALIIALLPEQRKRAILAGKIPRDVLEGPGKMGRIKAFEGLPASAMSDDQQALLQALIREYVSNADHDAAHRQLARIRADGLKKLHFAWFGPYDDEDARYYYRVHGPSVLIEYVVERGVGGDAANHTHSIMRDPSNDYGADWLGQHYREQHRR